MWEGLREGGEPKESQRGKISAVCESRPTKKRLDLRLCPLGSAKERTQPEQGSRGGPEKGIDKKRWEINLQKPKRRSRTLRGKYERAIGGVQKSLKKVEKNWKQTHVQGVRRERVTGKSGEEISRRNF